MDSKAKKIKYGKVSIPEESLLPQNVKERITIFLDQDVLDAFREKAKASGDKYQSLINRTLREAIKRPDLEARVEAIEQKLKLLG